MDEQQPSGYIEIDETLTEAEFEALKQRFANLILDAYDTPEPLRYAWRELKQDD